MPVVIMSTHGELMTKNINPPNPKPGANQSPVLARVKKMKLRRYIAMSAVKITPTVKRLVSRMKCQRGRMATAPASIFSMRVSLSFVMVVVA